MSNEVQAVKFGLIARVVPLAEPLYSNDIARSLSFNASPVVLAGLFYLALRR